MKSNNYSSANFAKANAARRAAPNCKNGHPFSGDNLRLDVKGRRVCRTCAIEFNKRRRFAGASYLKKDFHREIKAEVAVETIAELAKRYELPVKNDEPVNQSRAEWMRIYGLKQKRVFVDYSNIDVPWGLA